MSELHLASLDDLPPKPRRPNFFRRHFILVVTGAVLVVFLVYVAYLTVSLPTVAFLAQENPTTTALMEQRAAESRRAGETPRRVQSWIPLSAISERLIQAVVMGEDAAFFGHAGFDLHEIRESLRRNWERGGFARGASTITQQLAKNLFLSTDKTLSRKLKEALLTLRLETTLSKRRILEIYLNVIEWGDGIYGAEAAAQTYFGKSARYLDAAEAALLAAMIPNPRYLNPATRMKSLKIRQERILGWMERAGHLTPEERRQAAERSLFAPAGGPESDSSPPSADPLDSESLPAGENEADGDGTVGSDP